MNEDEDQLSVGQIKDALAEKTVAAVVMGENGNVVVQYGDKVTVVQSDDAARLSARLLEVIADFRDQ